MNIKKLFKRIVPLVLCVATLSITPAFAADITADASVGVEDRMTLYFEEDVTFNCGAEVHVKYTILDSTGDITGVQSLKVTYYPNTIHSVTAFVSAIRDNEIVITVSYYNKVTEKWESEGGSFGHEW